MTEIRMITVAVVLAACPGRLNGQSLLDRPPNLSGDWLGAPGTVQFNFVHRFTVSPAPQRKVANSPTFLLSYRLPVPLMIGLNYATSSDVVDVGTAPNEWELFARYAHEGPLHLGGQVGYNRVAKSADGEVSLGKSVQRLRLLAVARVMSHAYGTDTTRYAIGGGFTFRLSRWVAAAGDATTLLKRRGGEDVAWGAGLHIAIPYSPHSVSLQVTNTHTATLEGASRGLGKARAGFEFTIPFTLSRYFGRRKTSGEGAANATPAEMRTMTFSPSRLEVAAGTTVRWTNNDQLVHSVTADDGSWDSGPIEPGRTWSHTFAPAGEYAFHCTPHPFMKGVVVVR